MAINHRLEWSRTATLARPSTAALALLLAMGCSTDLPQGDTGGSASPPQTTAASSDSDSESPTDDGSEPTTSTDPSTGSPTDDGAQTSGPIEPPTSDTGGGDSDEGSDGGSTGVPTDPGPDFREPGEFTVQSTSSSIALSTGCTMDYDLRGPDGVDDAPVVVLAHGFQGNRASMAGWAEHWASWGVRVISPDMCHATILDTDHAQNGDDLRALAEELDLGPVIYAGYSAGGLAAVVAASLDTQTVALLGLDMVDNADLGAGAAASITAPAFDIVGEPSQCNTTNNGIAVFQTAGGQIAQITEADHCDFQSPSDFLCGLTCAGPNQQFDAEDIAAAVRGLSTAVVLWHTGIDLTGAQWWTPGSAYFDELTGTGILQTP